MSWRVWHLCANRWNSAITEYALSAARALAQAGHSCTFTPLANSPAEARARQHLTTKPVARFAFGSLRELSALARDIDPDIVITYGGVETLLARAMRLPARSRVVRFRGQALAAGGILATARHHLAHAHVALILTPSERLAQALRTIDATRPVACVPLGLDTDVFHRSEPVAAGMQRPEMIVLGRLDPVKGHAAVISMTASLLKAWQSPGPKPRLHIIGEPANLGVTHINGMVAASGLQLGDDVIVSAERIPDIARLLSTAALGIVPSIGSEIICRVAEEFLLCGTPVAVSGVGSLEEVLFDGAGFSYGSMDAEATTRQLVEWLGISSREDELAKARRAARAKELYSLSTMGRALTNLLA